MPPTARRTARGLVAVAVITAVGLAATAADPVKPPSAPRFPFAAEESKEYQAGYAKAAVVPVEVTNAVGMRLVLVPPGRFEMGPNGSKHRDTLSKPYYIGATEVTLADALQDAGCENPDVLDHCRGPGPHVRDCRVVGPVPGKA